MDIAIDQLRRLAAGMFKHGGCEPDIAQDIAEHLIEANRHGYSSHGIALLPKYLSNIAKNDVTPNARPEKLTEKPGVLRFHAHNGFGQHAAKVAISAAILKAKAEGYCLLTLCHAHHLGRLGHYGQMAADAGLCLFAASNVTGRPALVAPWGGAQARLATNPFCFAWPVPNGRPTLLVDFATSSMALNKAHLLAQQGEHIPPGQIIDAMGNPSDDPAVLFAASPGALLPFGGHKGYGLALMIELMAGVLAGGDTIAEDHSAHGSAHNHLFALLLDPDKFCGKAQAESKVSIFIDYLLQTRPQAGNAKVIYPGMPEAAMRATQREKITLPYPVWQWIVEWYAHHGIDLHMPAASSA